jgi:hypothetical protein
MKAHFAIFFQNFVRHLRSTRLYFAIYPQGDPETSSGGPQTRIAEPYNRGSPIPKNLSYLTPTKTDLAYETTQVGHQS